MNRVAEGGRWGGCGVRGASCGLRVAGSEHVGCGHEPGCEFGYSHGPGVKRVAGHRFRAGGARPSLPIVHCRPSTLARRFFRTNSCHGIDSVVSSRPRSIQRPTRRVMIPSTRKRPGFSAPGGIRNCAPTGVMVKSLERGGSGAFWGRRPVHR